MVLGGKPLTPLPGCKLFCFRVRYGEYVSQIATIQYANLAEAYQAVTRTHPGAQVTVIQPGPLAADGLPET